jgi:hypothetical protein
MRFPPVVLFTNGPYLGGMEQHVLLLGHGLVSRDIRVAAICWPRPEIARLRGALAEAGVRIHNRAERQASTRGLVRPAGVDPDTPRASS